MVLGDSLRRRRYGKRPSDQDGADGDDLEAGGLDEAGLDEDGLDEEPVGAAGPLPPEEEEAVAERPADDDPADDKPADDDPPDDDPPDDDPPDDEPPGADEVPDRVELERAAESVEVVESVESAEEADSEEAEPEEAEPEDAEPEEAEPEDASLGLELEAEPVDPAGGVTQTAAREDASSAVGGEDTDPGGTAGASLGGMLRSRRAPVWRDLLDRIQPWIRRGIGQIRRPIGAWIASAAVILVGSFVVGYFLSTQVLFPRPATAGSAIGVPSLVGQSRASAESAIREAGLTVGDVRELASQDVERDEVVAQDPIPGQQLRPGAAVALAVSSGPPMLRIPPVRGLGMETARDLLEDAGFQVALRLVEDRTEAAGTVVRTDPPAGTLRDLPSRVTLYVVTEVERGDSVPTGIAPVGGAGRPQGEAGDP